eukprot:TRINITY_DN5308_c0_g1_i1.p1 TRINITY_DN5308_c0_g1~~TRINITY_DN5308_c0_g1_i1.p1  ORF type:complete len:248 (+),score=28.54 TRINITY_DN5308_c0_g1_i1:146-889(+)
MTRSRMIIVVVVYLVGAVVSKTKCDGVDGFESAVQLKMYNDKGNTTAMDPPYFFVPYETNSTDYRKYSTVCTPTSSNIYGPDFKKYSTDSKTFACTVNSSSALQSVFHHHSLVFISDKDNKDCGCTFNPTPTGQYVVGATIKLYGFYDQNMEYSNIYKRSGCEVEIQYSPNPLRDGDIFQQTIITVDISSWWDHNSLSVIFFFIAAAPLIVLIVIVVAIVLIVRSCIRSSGPHHQKNADKNNAYVVL